MNLGTDSSPFAVWITGISCVGKTTLATWLQHELGGILIDGDDLRARGKHLTQDDHPFGKDSRRQNALYAAHLAKQNMKLGKNACISLISPDREVREEAMVILEHRCLVVCLTCPMPELLLRDKRQLYSRAMADKIHNVAGVDVPYESPEVSENAISLDTSLMCHKCCGRTVLHTLRNRGLLNDQSKA